MRDESGMSLIEVMLSLLIFVIMGLGVAFILQSDGAITINNEHKMYAMDIANSVLSDIRANSSVSRNYSGVSVSAAGVSGASSSMVTSSLSDSVVMMKYLPGGLIRISVTPMSGGTCPCAGTISTSWSTGAGVEYFTLNTEVSQ